MSQSVRFRTNFVLTTFLSIFLALVNSPTFSDPIREGQIEPVGLPIAAPKTAGLRFSNSPTDDEFLRTSLFVQPLIPVGTTNPEENIEFAASLLDYYAATRQGDRDAVQPLLTFLADHPNSAWTPALQVNLGAVYRRTGHFSKALETWQAAWDGTKDATDPNGRALGDIAVAYLSQFQAYLGRKETLEPLLQEAKARPIRGSAAELISQSASGLADMLTRPDIAFKCGPSALARILSLKPSPTSAQSRRVLNQSESTPRGLSLRAVQAISVEAGMGYQMAFRSPGAQFIFPAVAHWKVGHYAALLGNDRAGRYVVGDVTFGEDIVMSHSALEEETSGYFLVPSGQLPHGWRRVDASEGETIWGRGDTGSNHDVGATGGQEIQAFPCSSGGGCTTWNVEATILGLSMHDDPIGYTPPIGPPIRFPMYYSHRDSLQPIQFGYMNFGNKWTTNWLSYVTDNGTGCTTYGPPIDPPAVSVGAAPVQDPPIVSCATLYRRGGGNEVYVLVGETSFPGPYSQAQLTRLTDPTSGLTLGFSRTLPDGSVEKFQKSLPPNQFFMTEVDDPQGNAAKINYDGLMRIVSVTDAIGQVTTICYSDSWQTQPLLCRQPTSSSNPLDNLQVTQIRDPFGRSAYFGYDPSNGHLTSITDVLGITSSFAYGQGTNPEGGDFINSLTTPYGTTQFAFADALTDTTLGSTRSVKITDPMQRVSFVEFHQGTGAPFFPCSASNNAPVNNFANTSDLQGIACDETNPPNGMPYGAENNYLQYRNTFIWDPYQYSTCTINNHPCYYQAKLIHWLHTNELGDPSASTNPSTCSRTPESIKHPLESRVWFNYPNQTLNVFCTNPGACNLNSSIGTVPSMGVGSS
ncbi:MAG: hypothetical protein ACLP0A_00935 [Verrucomicrobiia bacterium]